jgi:hypothetical protein
VAGLPDDSYRYSRILERLEQAKRLVQQSKDRIAESERLQETYDEHVLA